jgi:hypothetical protein
MQPQSLRPAARARLIAWFLAVLVFGSVLPLKASEVIRLGEINPLSGQLAKHGLEIHQGIL